MGLILKRVGTLPSGRVYEWNVRGFENPLVFGLGHARDRAASGPPAPSGR